MIAAAGMGYPCRAWFFNRKGYPIPAVAGIDETAKVLHRSPAFHLSGAVYFTVERISHAQVLILNAQTIKTRPASWTGFDI